MAASVNEKSLRHEEENNKAGKPICSRVCVAMIIKCAIKWMCHVQFTGLIKNVTYKNFC